MRDIFYIGITFSFHWFLNDFCYGNDCAEHGYFWWIGKNALNTDKIVQRVNSHQWGGKWEVKEERDNVKALKKYFCLGGGLTQNNASLNFLLWRVIEKKKKGRREKGKKERREGGRKIKKIKWLSIKARKQEGEKVGKKKVIYGGTTLSPCFSLAGPLIFLPYYLPKPKCLGHNWNSWKGSGEAKVLPSVDAHWGNNICNSVGPGVSKL